jgi:hypothetical protein
MYTLTAGVAGVEPFSSAAFAAPRSKYDFGRSDF